MFKLFCRRYRYKIGILKYILRKSYVKFNYSRIIPRKKKIRNYRKSYIANLHYLLKFRTYYGDMTIKKFRRYLQRVNIRRIDFEVRICILLESRLNILLFRLNLIKTPREGKHIIRCKKIKINGKKVSILNRQLYINDIIYFEKNMSLKFYNNVRIKSKILFNYPKYLEMSYNLMKCVFIFYPRLKYIPTT